MGGGGEGERGREYCFFKKVVCCVGSVEIKVENLSSISESCFYALATELFLVSL